MDKIVLTPEDLGTGLKVQESKVVVDVAALNIPVDVKLSGVAVDKDAKTMKFTLSSGDVITQDIADFLAVDTDTKIKSANLEGSTLNIVSDLNGTETLITVDLHGLLDDVSRDVDAVKADINSLKEKDKDLERRLNEVENKKPTGTVLKSLGGTTLGYVVSEDDVNVA